MHYLKEKVKKTITPWEDIDVVDFSDVSFNKAFWSGKETHVLQVPIDSSLQYYNELTFTEKNKAKRFRRQKDQHRFITSRGVLRVILASYMTCEYSDLVFRNTTYGKPIIIPYDERKKIHFNITYSNDVICYVFSKENEVGIDIEYIKEGFNWIGVARTYYTNEELTFLKALPLSQQVEAFICLWTYKEALLKMKGIGLSGIDELSNWEVSHRNYDVTSFSCGKEYRGSLAIKRKNSVLRYLKLNVLGGR